MTHLWSRLVQAKKVLEPVESKYRIVYEDPFEPSNPVSVVIPDPHWLAAALVGGILPPIESYIRDQEIVEQWGRIAIEQGIDPSFSWARVPDGAHHPYATPIGPMSEEAAIEYLIMKDVHPSVWRDYKGNKQILVIVPVEAIPTDRTNRDAWKIDQMEIV